MTDQVAESGDATQTESGVDGKKVTVDRSAEEYAQRLLEVAGENKKFRESNVKLRSELDSIKSKLSEVETQTLNEQGKWKEAAEKYKKELDAKTLEASKMQKNYAYQTVSSQLKAEAVRAGCLAPDELIALVSAKGILADLDVDDSFTVTEASIKSVLDKAKSDKGMKLLFGGTAAAVKDVTPNSKVDTKDDFSKMSIEQKTRKLADIIASGH